MTHSQSTDELVKRLRDADTDSVQRMTGSRIFGEAADTIERLQGELAARDKTIEALREDAERLDWLEAERTDVPGTLFRSNNRITRAAIDAARSEERKL